MLKCKICGHEGKQLHQHIIYKHNLSTVKYKEKYGASKLQLVTLEQCKMRSNRAKTGGTNRRVEYWLKRGYNEIDAIQQVKKVQSSNGKHRRGGRASTAFQYEWWMKKYNLSKEDAIQKVYTIQSKNSSKSARFTGKKSTPERNRKISIAMSTHIKTVGKEKWIKHFGNYKKYYRSKPEIELFKYIKHTITNKAECNVFIGNINVDILYNNKIIEFFGDYWHCNPLKFNDTYFNKHLKKPAIEIRNKDKTKIETLISKGYDVMIIWESDWYSDINGVKNRIVEFLT